MGVLFDLLPEKTKKWITALVDAIEKAVERLAAARMPGLSPIDLQLAVAKGLDPICKDYKDQECKEAFKTLKNFSNIVTDSVETQEKVGVALLDVAYKIEASFGEINTKITEITDEYVAEFTDIRKGAKDWYDLPPKITAHVDSTIRSVATLKHLLEILVSVLWVLTILIIIKLTLETVFEAIGVFVFRVKRPRRLFPIGTANRSASLPFIWRMERKRRIELKRLNATRDGSTEGLV